MGSNRKKKQVLNNSNNGTKIRAATTMPCKPEEAAASSMSSESSTEAVVRTTFEFAKLSTSNSKMGSNAHSRNSELLWESDELERVRQSSPQIFRFSWNEILALCFMLLTFAMCSIIVGVAAGVSISIHYYESPENLDQRRMATTDSTQWAGSDSGGRVHTQTVTHLDPTIVTYGKNYYYPTNKEERVVHTDASTGMRIALNVVVESPSLSKDGPSFIPHNNWTHGVDHHNDDENYGINGNNNNNNGGGNQNYYHQGGAEKLTPPRSGKDNFDVWLHNPPKLCPDAKTMGYDSWTSLRGALNDVNRYSAQQSDRWIIYFTTLAAMKMSSSSSPNSYTTSGANPYLFPQGGIPILDDDSFYYEEQFVLTICPGIVMKAGSYPLIIDTESLTLQCDGCTITGGDSHLSFGSSAKNALIRGITFQKSLRSSIVLQHSGAEATFEDCVWVVRDIQNDIRQRHILPGLNEITNVNSSSTLNFYRCSTIQPTLSRFLSYHWWMGTGS